MKFRSPTKSSENTTTHQTHTFYLGNRGNHTIFQPWGQCSCGTTINDPHLIVEHIEQNKANVNNSNAYTLLKYMVEHD